MARPNDLDRIHDEVLIDGPYSAFGPLLFAPLSEIYGRVRLLQTTNILFLGGYKRIEVLQGKRAQYSPAFNLGCGFAQNKTELMVLRFMAGLGGGAPLAVRVSPQNPIDDVRLRFTDWWRPNIRRLEARRTRQGDITIPSCSNSGSCRGAAGRSLVGTSIRLEVDILGINYPRCDSPSGWHFAA